MAFIGPHKIHGFQIQYWITFLDGTRKRKFRRTHSLTKASAIKKDADNIERVSQLGLTDEEVAYFVKVNIISTEEALKLTKNRAYSGLSWDILETYYLNRFKSIASESSMSSYPYKVRVVVNYFIKLDLTPETVTEQDIEAYLRYKRNEGKAKATCNKYLGVLRIMLDEAVKVGAITSNPARKVKAFKDTTERVPRIIYPTEFKGFLASLDSKAYLLKGYFKELLMTYLYTGMRSSELLRVRCSDVNLRQGYITIQESKNSQGRIIEIHPELKPVIGNVLRKNGISEGYLFGGKDKPLCLAPSVTHAFMKLTVPEGVTLHSLRHTFITYMLQSGNDLKTVQKAAGHKRLSTTFRYTHFIPSKNTVSRIKYGWQKTSH